MISSVIFLNRVVERTRRKKTEAEHWRDDIAGQEDNHCMTQMGLDGFARHSIIVDASKGPEKHLSGSSRSLVLFASLTDSNLLSRLHNLESFNLKFLVKTRKKLLHCQRIIKNFDARLGFWERENEGSPTLNSDFVQFSSVMKAATTWKGNLNHRSFLCYQISSWCYRLMDSVSVHDDCIVVLCIKSLPNA